MEVGAFRGNDPEIAGQDKPTGPTILLVEDNRTLSMLTADLLHQEGFTVDLLYEGRPALEQVRRVQYRLILMNVNLPDVNGLDVTRQLKADPLTCTIPIIIVTAQAMQVDRERSRQAGADAYLSKPYDVYDLFELIRQLLA
ncbi:MAG: response regulator [Gemmatimonadaceae bacterium]|nr:response regulator [Gloeobacterales cyanobacterium ES-bin-141]